VAAARELLDRGHGKAVQSVELSGPDGTPIPISRLAEYSDEQLEQLDELLSGGAPASPRDGDADARGGPGGEGET
jgi:hypothetical protein